MQKYMKREDAGNIIENTNNLDNLVIIHIS